MKLPIIRSAVPVLSVEQHRPQIGEKTIFISRFDLLYKSVTDWINALAAYVEEINCVSEALDTIIETQGAPILVDAQNARRGSIEYLAAIQAAPVTPIDASIDRRLLIYNLQPEEDVALSDIFIAEESNGQARWAGPVLSPYAIRV